MIEVHDLRRQIHDYIVATFLFGADDLSDDASLLADGILDSMAVLEMVLFIEETLGVPVADEEVLPEHFDSVEALTRFVIGKATAQRLESAS